MSAFVYSNFALLYNYTFISLLSLGMRLQKYYFSAKTQRKSSTIFRIVPLDRDLWEV